MEQAKAILDLRLQRLTALGREEISEELDKLAVEIAGSDGLGWEGDDYPAAAKSATREWLRARGNTIEGGTSEIQLDIIAKHTLRKLEQRREAGSTVTVLTKKPLIAGDAELDTNPRARSAKLRAAERVA